MLQCVAVCCTVQGLLDCLEGDRSSVLQCVAVCCGLLHCTGFARLVRGRPRVPRACFIQIDLCVLCVFVLAVIKCVVTLVWSFSFLKFLEATFSREIRARDYNEIRELWSI